MRVTLALIQRVVFGMALLAMVDLELTAGEPITFSRGKVAEAPVRPVTPQNQALRSLASPTAAFELDNYTPSARERRGQDRDRTRRSKNARDERKNWTSVDSGSLTERDDDEAAFGIRSYSIEDDGNSESGDMSLSDTSTLRSTAQAEARESRVPLHLRSPRERQVLEAKAVERSRATSDERSAQEGQLRRKGAETRGAHLNGELDLQSLFGEPDTGGSSAPKSEITLGDIFNGNSRANARPLSDGRSGGVRELLGLPQADQLSPANRLDTLLGRSDARINPAPPVDVRGNPSSSERPLNGSPVALTPWATPGASARPGIPELVAPSRSTPVRDLGPSLGGADNDRRGSGGLIDAPRRPGVLGR